MKRVMIYSIETIHDQLEVFKGYLVNEKQVVFVNQNTLNLTGALKYGSPYEDTYIIDGVSYILDEGKHVEDEYTYIQKTLDAFKEVDVFTYITQIFNSDEYGTIIHNGKGVLDHFVLQRRKAGNPIIKKKKRWR
ncbi:MULTISPECIES: hypothetical protein [Bacillus]|uniref:hypothetical protein n=1 Tax=Bacillus TaxID=1386 RepID=UPI002AB4259A|nr:MULTISPECIES: hypothetical protein [Bacillus]MDY7903518.1 hypothetical protein [Bacillus sp. AG1]